MRIGGIYLCAVLVAWGLIAPGEVRAQYRQTFSYYLEQAQQAYRNGDVQEAVFLLEAARAIRPDDPRPQRYLHRIQQGLTAPTAPVRPVHKASRKTAELREKRPPLEKTSSPAAPTARAGPSVSVSLPEVLPERPSVKPPEARHAETVTPLFEAVVASDELRQQAEAVLDIPLQQTVTLKGDDIQRFLLITEGVFQVERVDRRELRITAVKIGTSFLHIWDARGRWTLHLKSVLPPPAKTEAGRLAKDLREVLAEPFKVSYVNRWDALYRGDDIPGMTRQNLTFTQWTGIAGPTPYGDVDASLNTYLYPASTEIVGQRVGLTRGHIGPFQDFTLRGYDTFVNFSPLSLPGRSFRGALLDAYAFDRNINYTVFQGQDRAAYLFASPGIVEERRAYLEGAQITLFPDGDHRYALNYTRGYGAARADSLKKRAYSFETEHRTESWQGGAEVAHDEDRLAGLARGRWKGDRFGFGVNLRDIERGYQTISGPPAAAGEIGGVLNWDWRPGGYEISTGLDLYRDRAQERPDHEDDVNLEGRLSWRVPLSPKASLNSAAYYDHTPQLYNPRESLRWNNTYNQGFSWFGGRYASFFVGGTAQANRYQNSPQSEFNRYSLSSGLRLPLLDRWAYYLNYEYSWVEALSAGELHHPQVLSTGLNYDRKLTDTLSGTLGLEYRDEQESEGEFSFLSGEDSLRGSLGLSYRPVREVEVFLDSSLRNVWAENADRSAYNEADVRVGMRSDWNLPFRWNPTGVVRGVVFNDLNGDGRRGDGEPGLGGVIVLIGRQEALCDARGLFKMTVKALEVEVRPDLNTVPSGFLSSSPEKAQVKIKQGEMSFVSFGFTAKSGIYGVVFADTNRNGRADPGEKLFTGVRLVLDGRQRVYTDTQGGYRFGELSAGAHQLRIDLNTVPLQYLPLIPLVNTVNVREGNLVPFSIPLRHQ